MLTMASGESGQNFVLEGVTSLNREELGHGAYGKVYAVKYCETICAAKEIHSILIEDVREAEREKTIQSFLQECRQCSMLHHPNVIQFLGVYYPTEVGGANSIRLPVMVMEMMADSLTSFVDKHEKIPVHIKYSIVYDVSLGLCYLHNRAIVHRDLSPNNVLLTTHHVAKISDLGVAKVIKADSRKTMTKAPGTVDFMPPEALSTSPLYGLSLDVFSFAGIILYTFTQQWPRPTDQVEFDPMTRRRVALSEVERRQQYLDKMIGEAEVLRPLVEKCLDDDPAVRPTIVDVYKRIQVNKDANMKESPQDVITLYHELKKKEDENKHQKDTLAQQRDQLENENKELRNKNEELENDNKRLSNENELQKTSLKNENKELRNKNEELENDNKRLSSENELQKTTIEQGKATIEQLSSTRSLPTQVTSQHEGSTAEKSKFRLEAPPLMPALTSGRYDIQWTQLADLPVPLYNAYVAVQHHKIYVTGTSPVDDAVHQVHVYNINTDQWDQLPPSGHYYGIPHIIGGRLAIIGGYLSATNRITNKVSTLDEKSRKWSSYYPDLLSNRCKPGIVSHLEHIIVAGGLKSTAKDDGSLVVQDDIEILNWIENSHWRRVFIRLPKPMFGFTPTISNGDVIIVGYGGADPEAGRNAYKIAFTHIIASVDHDYNIKWAKLTAADYDCMTLVSRSSPPVVVGGKIGGAPSADIRRYDNSNKSWKKIGSLSSARCKLAVVAVYDNAMIVIGGCTKSDTTANARSSSLTVVELGQAKLLH